MAISTLDIDDPREDVLTEHVHSFSATETDDFAAVHAPRFNTLVNEWLSLNETRVQLVIALARAVAKAIAIDAKLDAIVDLLIETLDRLTGRDRNDPIWYTYFKGEDTWSFKRPILKGQLARMTVWPDSLAKSQHQALVDIGTALVPLLAQGEAADKGVDIARQALLDFDTVGPWAQYIEKSNAERRAIYGELFTIPSKHPEAKLPSDYAEMFFLHDTSRRGAGKPKSAAQISEELKKVEKRAEALRTALMEATQREENEAKASAEREAKERQLAEAKQEEKEAKARKKALEKELGKKK